MSQIKMYKENVIKKNSICYSDNKKLLMAKYRIINFYLLQRGKLNGFPR